MLKKLSFALAAILSVSLLASCVINTSDDDEKSGVDFGNYYSTGDYSIIVKNNTAKSLVCFKGAPSKDSLMGGVRPNSQVALKNNKNLFGTTPTDFLLFLVTEEDYKENEGNLEALALIPFGQVYAYYNTDSPNTRVYEISSHMGGDCKLLVNNRTSYNIELREGGIYEAALGYVGPKDLEKTFRLAKEKYRVYPVFRKFDRKSNEILSQFPKYDDGEDVVEVFGFDDQTTELEFDADDWVGTVDFKLAASCSYLEFANESQTGVSLYEGNSTALQTSSGYSVINAGKTRMFDITMTKTADGKWKDSTIKATYKYGDAAIGKAAIPSNEYKAGYMYTFTIQQDPSTNNKTKTIGAFDVDDEGKVKAIKYDVEAE